MQWNIQDLSNWEELRAYVDTALLPFYLYRPDLSVKEHVMRMTYLANVAASIEQRLKGRVLLFPLSYQVGDVPAAQQLPKGFSHYVLLQFSGDGLRAAGEASASILSLTVGDEDLASALRFDVTVDVLYQEILRHWRHSKHQ